PQRNCSDLSGGATTKHFAANENSINARNKPTVNDGRSACALGTGTSLSVERRRTNMGTRVIGTAPGFGLREPSSAIANTNMRRSWPPSGVNHKPRLKDEMPGEASFEGIVGQSPVLRHVLEQVETVATTDS